MGLGRLPAFLGTLGLVLVIAPATSRAEGPGDPARPTSKVSAPTPGQVQAARDLFAAASADEAAERWGDALQKLQRVVQVKSTAGVRYHIAFCEEKLGQIATALEHYSEALNAAKQEHNHEVETLLREPFLSDLSARVPRLTIDVPRDATGVDVTLDGHPHPSALWGVAIPLDPGSHRIEARADGREPFFRDLVLHERETSALPIVFAQSAPVRVATAPPTVTANPTPPPPSATTRSPPPMASPTPVADERPSRSLVAPVVVGIGALVLVGAGVGAYEAAGSAQTEGRTECLTRTNCDSLRTPVRTWDDVALGLWIGAGIAGVAAVVLWTSSGRSADSRVQLSAGPGLLRLEGTF